MINFRKAALDQLIAPEQLDEAVRVTTPKAWIALISIGIILVVVLIWSFTGSLATRINSNGILITKGGQVTDAIAPASGYLNAIHFQTGAIVKQGEVVATITLTEATERLNTARQQLQQQRAQYTATVNELNRESSSRTDTTRKRRERLQELLVISKEKIDTALNRLEDHRNLYEQQVITRVTLENSQSIYDAAVREQVSLLNSLDDIETQIVSSQTALERGMRDARNLLNASERRFEEVNAALSSNSRVVAPVAGRITEIKSTEGTLISGGAPVLSIESGGEGLEVVAFITASLGKRVKTDMDVLVDPVTVSKEESGALLGKILRVSEFPITLEGMLATLQNRELAQTFFRGGPPYEARIELFPDSRTKSKYRWTSKRGADLTLTSGTLVALEITTSRKKPITMVVPLLKKLLGEGSKKLP